MKTAAGHKEKISAAQESAYRGLRFNLLPGFADFLLKEKLREYVVFQFRLMVKLDFPMIKQASLVGISEEQVVDMSIPSHREFLSHAVGNSLLHYLKETLTRWKNDRHPHIIRDQLLTEDITLSLYVRKMALLEFIPQYTQDQQDVLKLVHELERYSLEAETLAFTTFIGINNRRIRRMNHQLESNTQQLLEAQEMASLGSFEWDLSRKHKHAFTPQVSKILGTSDFSEPEKLLEKVHPQDRKKITAIVKDALKGRREFECEYRWLNGGRQKVIWSRGLVQLQDGRPHRIKGTMIDVTARNKLLHQLQRKQELYKQAERLARLGNWTFDHNSRDISWSDEMYRICNMSPQSREITAAVFMGLIHPEDRMIIKAVLRSMLSGEQTDYHLRVKLPGDVVKHLHGKSEVLRDTNGSAIKIIGTCQDITKEVQMTEDLRLREESLATLNASLEEKNTELRRSNEELTSFNYVASHDLQEPLRKIKTFSDLLLNRERENLSAAGREWIDRISTSAARMQKLIGDLLSFSRTQIINDSQDRINLNELLNTICGLYENEINEGLLHIAFDPLPEISGVRFQIQQLFQNLLSNSLKYRRGAAVNVHVSSCRSEVINAEGIPDKSYLKLSFADDGIGFEQKYASRIFEIFQRLHGQLSYSGTGVGLAICKKIVENHGGFMRASGKPGRGAVFDIYFPDQVILPASQ